MVVGVVDIVCPDLKDDVLWEDSFFQAIPTGECSLAATILKGSDLICPSGTSLQI